MKKICLAGWLPVLFFCLCFTFSKDADPVVTLSTFGRQPAIAVDPAGNIQVAFGQGEDIFYTHSADGGRTFAAPQRVGSQPKLALGMTRGPQITATRDFTVIAAATHRGRIQVYRRRHHSTRWSPPVNILQADSTAPEGFVALAPGKGNTVYAAWLDTRLEKQNNIFFASSPDGGQTWTRNKLVYASPEGKVCPCCRPSIAADQQGQVYVMFRNELQGSRDMYLAHSPDGGRTFAPARKLGLGTWVLKACPMDGGALALDARGRVASTWRRESTIYYAEPGGLEKSLGTGRVPSLARTSRGDYLVWQQGDKILALSPGQPGAATLGTGAFPRVAALPGQGAISVWEANGQLLARRLP